jgi:exopolysaccharide biosynthesis polyprenyl glycosylphosphotransferase
MFHRQYQVYANLLLSSDVLSGLSGLYCAYYLRYYLVRFAPLEVSRYFNPELLPFREYLFYYLVFVPLWVGLLMLTQRYSEVMRLSLRRQAVRVVQFMAATGVLMAFLTYSFKLAVSRPIFFLFLVFVGLLLVLSRVILHWVLRSRNVSEHNQIKILIVGTDEKAKAVGRLLEGYRMWGYQVVGYLTTRQDQDEASGLPILGALEELPQLLQTRIVADEIIFSGAHRSNPQEFEAMIRLCEELGVRTRVAAEFFPTSTSRVSLEFLENLPLITYSTVPEHDVAIIAKRIVDFLVAAITLIVFSPLMLVTAGLVKSTSPGPVFYSQVRCGLYGRRFRLVKFRTMVDGAEDKLWEIMHLNEMEGPVFKMRNDPRVTSVGRFLRKFSVDELPQVWNVIKGEMSLVGPRAPLPEEVEHYETKQRRRLSVKPGITGLWQVSGRNDIDFHKWMELDLQYIDNWSFWLDIRIMLMTIPAVFTGRGAR